MKATLELFIQGGLGNQLIQLSYAESLRNRTGCALVVNPLLLSRGWARLKKISHRTKALHWCWDTPEVEGKVAQLFGYTRLMQSQQKNSLMDCLDDNETIKIIRGGEHGNWFGMKGYFQRYEAFGGKENPFWFKLKNKLTEKYSIKPFRYGQVVAHVRLGDYLTTENRRIFEEYKIEKQLIDAQEWSEKLGESRVIHLVTDDPARLRILLNKHKSGQYSIYSGKSDEDDFLFLARHRHIVGCNSTFSLCSGRLSAELWGERHVIRIPSRWYKDDVMNDKMQTELDQCSFIKK